MKWLTPEQHRDVVARLLALGQTVRDGTQYHPAGPEYTSLMVCFLLHNLSAADALVRLAKSFGGEWFPATVGYTIARTMFETDVTAHYITQSPADRARQYIAFGAVLKKREMEACRKHCKSSAPSWREAMGLIWDNHWASLETEVNEKFAAVQPQFERVTRKGKTLDFASWSGKSIRQMAEDVDHAEAYDVFYSELSSFAHVNVRLADRFLQVRQDGLAWSQRTDEYDFGNVFRHSASFLTCFLELFATQFGTWVQKDVQDCWEIGGDNNGIQPTK
ncbi:DUF5677 domain-containing protein [Candidatus Sumerlaeota bacterium]